VKAITPAERSHSPGVPHHTGRQQSVGSNDFLTADTHALAARKQRAQICGNIWVLLMAVDVRQRDAARLDLAYLSFSLPVDLPQQSCLRNCGIANCFRLLRKSGSHLSASADSLRAALHQSVRRDIQSSGWAVHGQIDCRHQKALYCHEVAKLQCRIDCPQRSRGDARGQAKIIRVNDERRTR